MILFIYIISLIFNKIILQKINYKIIFIYLIIIIFSHYIPMLNNINTLEINITYNEYPEIINLIKLYNFPINLINIFIINYLITLLIIVVKITNFSYGPIRIKI